MYKREMTTVAQCPKTIGSYIELVYAIFIEIHFSKKVALVNLLIWTLRVQNILE